MRTTRPLRALCVVVAATGIAALSALPATAANYYDPYTGSNPATTGCSADAITVATVPVHSQQPTYGPTSIEVRYSPSCQTNWVRATTSVPNSTYTVTKGITRPSGQADAAGHQLGMYQDYETDPAVGSSFGMQVYAPDHVCVEVMTSVADSTGQIVANTGADFPYNPWIMIC